jgi:hypothetical protein
MREVSRMTPSSETVAYVVEAELALAGDVDPAAVGAAVTVELCGQCDHDGACRWPHNSAIDTAHHPARFRTLFVADEDEATQVRERIESALRAASSWHVVSLGARPVAEHERALADRLRAGPRAEA